VPPTGLLVVLQQLPDRWLRRLEGYCRPHQIPADPKDAGRQGFGLRRGLCDRQRAWNLWQTGVVCQTVVPTRREEPGPAVEAGPARSTLRGLAALDAACKAKYAGKTFAELPTATRMRRSRGSKVASSKSTMSNGQAFFERHQRRAEGVFAEPGVITAAIVEMGRGKMIGYPGAR